MPTFITSDGLTLHYEDQGSGSVLLCLAGLTRNARDFEPLLPHLPHHRIIRLDYRGRGNSDYDPDFTHYSVPREAEDVIELLDHLALDRVTLLGTSRGGLIAMMLGATHVHRLNGVILNDIGPVIDMPGLSRIMAYVGNKPVAKTYDDAALGLAKFYGDEFPGVSVETWRRQAVAMYLETETGLELRYDPALKDAFNAQASSNEEVDLWPLFETLNAVPVAVIRGGNSDLLSAKTLSDMQARHPNLIAATVPDRGHVPFLDEPESLTMIHTLLERTA
ncbi:alpha/beta fold hydrolase [Aestuariibius sp. HNIBRBA575]|uniref:alpha/beta fold hydrolase n=1 Tax=Aestuariibius sp. HNIBRBA575 TaxID=3233343 RepID=UPI0034A22D08